MKDQKQMMPLAAFVTVMALTLLATVIRTAFLFTAYEADVGYFQSGLPTVLVALLYLVGTAVCIGSFLLLPKKALSPRATMSFGLSLSLKLPATLACFLCGVGYLINGALNSEKLTVLQGLLLIISTLYFLFSLLCDRPHLCRRLAPKRPWFGFAVLAALIALLSSSYFDMTVNINGPFTTLGLFSLLSCAVFLLGEIRSEIGASIPRMHLAAGLFAFFLTFSSSVGNLLFCLLGETGASKTLADPMRPIFLLTVSLFIFYRLLSFIVPKQEK